MQQYDLDQATLGKRFCDIIDVNNNKESNTRI